MYNTLSFVVGGLGTANPIPMTKSARSPAAQYTHTYTVPHTMYRPRGLLLLRRWRAHPRDAHVWRRTIRISWLGVGGWGSIGGGRRVDERNEKIAKLPLCRYANLVWMMSGFSCHSSFSTHICIVFVSAFVLLARSLVAPEQVSRSCGQSAYSPS